MKISILLAGAVATVVLQAKDFVPEAQTGAAIQKAIDEAFAGGGGRVALVQGMSGEAVR